MENPHQTDEMLAEHLLNSGLQPVGTEQLGMEFSKTSTSGASVDLAQSRGLMKMNSVTDESLKGTDITFTNMKDNPFCMMHTVQQSVIFQALDFSYITSRIAVMSYPGKTLESACGNYVDDVREYLDLRHPGHYAVYNVSGHVYTSTKFTAKVYEAGWPTQKAPPFKTLVSLCRNMYLYLRQDPKNVCVVHCLDGKSSSAVLVCAFLIFCKLFTQPEEALKMFAARRCPVDMTPSQLRYLQYVSFIVDRPPLLPHNNTVALHSISVQPVPLCQECSDGCRPFVEVYVGEECIFTSLQDYENIRYYNFSDKCIVIPIAAVVTGDVNIVVYHAKSESSRGRRATSKMFQMQFHSGFLSSNAQTMIFKRNELDCVDAQSGDFTVTVLFNSSYKKLPDLSPLFRKVAQLKVNPELLFNADEDLEEFTSLFMDKENISESSDKDTRNSDSLNRSERSSTEDIRICSESEHSVPGLDDDFHTAKNDAFNLQFVPPSHESDAPLIDLIGGASLPADDADFVGGVWHLHVTKDADLVNPDSLLSENSCNETADSFFQVHSDSVTSEDDFCVNFASGASSTFTKTYSNTDNELSPMSGLSLSMPSFTANSADNNEMAQDDPHSPLFSTNYNGKVHTKTISHHVSVPNLKALANSKSDPFADLGNIISSFGLSTEEKNKTDHSHFTESSLHFQKQSSFSEGISQKPGNKRGHFSSVFTDRNHRGAKKYSGVKPKLDGNEFEDLLGSQGFGGFQRNVEDKPKTIAKLRHMEMVKDMDPERLKVLDWVGCKQRNIRALLCSLHTVLWEGTQWQEIGMHRLISAGDVKRYYRKACLAVHPDKQMGTKNENLARLIFMELKDAWSKFEKQPNIV